jgi:hypothetical protein
LIIKLLRGKKKKKKKKKKGKKRKKAYTMRLSFLLHCQIGANMLHIARVRMLNSNQLRKVDISGAIAELEKAKDLLHNSIRFVFATLTI